MMNTLKNNTQKAGRKPNRLISLQLQIIDQVIDLNGLSKFPACEQRTDTYLGRSPRWRKDPVLCHTLNNPRLLHQWWRAQLGPQGGTGTAWKGGASSCSHRWNSCHIHSPPNERKKSEGDASISFILICTQNRLVAHLHCYNRTTILVEKRLHHGEQLAHPFVYCRNVIWEIQTHTIDLLTEVTRTGATCDVFPKSQPGSEERSTMSFFLRSHAGSPPCMMTKVQTLETLEV